MTHRYRTKEHNYLESFVSRAQVSDVCILIHSNVDLNVCLCYLFYQKCIWNDFDIPALMPALLLEFIVFKALHCASFSIPL